MLSFDNEIFNDVLGFWYLMNVTYYILAKWTAVGVRSTQCCVC
jgi:hypothetical protein